MKLYRIGELSKLASVSARTIDYYTSLGLIEPMERSTKNYRLYSDETLIRLKRIEQMKKDKFTLDEIKSALSEWDKVSSAEQVTQRMTDLERHLSQLQREVKELEPVLKSLKPKQVNKVYTRLMPQTIACIEALMILLNKNNLM
ncbi:MerR family transcriptional regulator [Paenibacillus protaetiae]|uniref:MerR family transcriptional regulator n=1 Tax=Paenibacillus protaetiae TaxID=2509456 RepID=A0A4P6ETA6_9BACL|nr:MerR family transcriptional regulator [Paenibacillus protaetiae]QAY66400.1 MerR family transcriptional regulator [Paenibacillus protaetiae]